MESLVTHTTRKNYKICEIYYHGYCTQKIAALGCYLTKRSSTPPASYTSRLDLHSLQISTPSLQRRRLLQDQRHNPGFDALGGSMRCGRRPNISNPYHSSSLAATRSPENPIPSIFLRK
ncbi:hypothetical protein V6N13_071916 [Hibiscus sabdariffa]|uniref:Uncharacterized protein n=1 Tax=Hibiscus sabdariffa TaxID=183260 RepID=A0ABR2TC41_9ROSI